MGFSYVKRGGVSLDEIGQLYEMYSRDVYKFVLSMSRNGDVAEDVMQSTFLGAMKSLHTYKGQSSVKTWLIGIAKHEYYAYLKKCPSMVSLDQLGGVEWGQQSGVNVDYIVLMDAIAELEEPDKTIVVLRLINELSFKEIGELVGESESFCRVMFFRCKQKLRHCC
ncbi:MAG TPA: hypothetical protein DCY20_05965 [Firmicutes bacterium]|nr:hypothetical protein [Bacillota bacterium]